MATSRKQIEANRRNATLSTGPRTAEGKVRSSMNAVTHGFTAQRIVIDGEDPEEFAAFVDCLIEDYRPQIVLESYLVEQVAGYLWRLRRCPRCEAAIRERYREMVEREKPKKFDPVEFLRTPYTREKGPMSDLARKYGITDEMARKNHERMREEIADKHGIDLEEFDKAPPPRSEELAEKESKEVLRTLGSALIKDASEFDALGKLARYEAHLMNGLERTIRLLERLRERRIKDPKDSNNRSSVIDLVSDKTAG